MRASQSAKKRYPYQPDYLAPPGWTLLETIDALGIGQRDLAMRLETSSKHINSIMKGLSPITHKTALGLELVTGVSARVWNALEVNYRHHHAQQEEHDRLQHETAWLKRIPTKELILRGVLPSKEDPVNLLRAILGFFGVGSVAAWQKIWLSPDVAYRKSKVFEGKPEVMATWLRLGEMEALTIACERFGKAQFKDALHEIRKLTIEQPGLFEPKIKSLCAKAGVAVVLVPEIKGAPVSGATQWLTPTKAMIQLSLRHRTDDHFWFSFFHEAGHILLDGKKDKFIDVNQEAGEREDRANQFAANLLIPHTRIQELSQLTTPTKIRAFAASVGIAPGIVLGRLQHDNMIPFNRYNGLKQRFAWEK